MAGSTERSNFLLFINSTTEMIAIPADKVTLITNEGNTDVAIYFEGDDGAIGSLNLAVTSETEDSVIQALAKLLIFGRGVTLVADDVNSIYVDPNITALTAITISD